jgi:hypothetical protein
VVSEPRAGAGVSGLQNRGLADAPVGAFASPAENTPPDDE